jgi:hypothetical protein
MSVLFDFLAYYGPRALGDTYTDEEEAPSLSSSQKVKAAKEKIRKERRRRSALKRAEARKLEGLEVETEDKEENELNIQKGRCLDHLN